jgi:hypothetical protein
VTTFSLVVVKEVVTVFVAVVVTVVGCAMNPEE